MRRLREWPLTSGAGRRQSTRPSLPDLRSAWASLAAKAFHGLLLALACAAPAKAQEVVEYYGTDHLGSIRIVVDAAGNLIARADYLPYGEEAFAETGPLPAQQFTGQARDGEVGQDYFHARMYQRRNGRFISVDPVFNAMTDPQKWNRYSYVGNRPLRFIDPSGKDPLAFSWVLPDALLMQSIANGTHTIVTGISFWEWLGRELLDLVPGTYVLANSDLRVAETVGPSPTVQALVGGAIVVGSAIVGSLKFPKVLGKRGGMDHVLKRHAAGSTSVGTSRFLDGFGEHEIQNLIKEAAGKSEAWVPQANGLRLLEVDLGRTIGFDAEGNSLSAIRILIDDHANVVSSYPIQTK